MSESATPESPVAEGEIPPDGVVSLLGELESLRATGALTFDADGISWEVALVAGQIATDQPERPDGADAVEKLLDLRGGHYRVYQRLPPLPVSSGDATWREGSLAVHVPADLMNYCERAGLTGKLVFEGDHMRAEVLYDGGELSTIRLDGVEDLNDVFSWEEGSFRVDAARPEPEQTDSPKSEPAPKPESEPPLLSVVEVALASIVREREERRPGSRTGPALPPMPEPMTADTLPPPARGPRASRRDATVKVIYLGGGSSRRKSSTQESSQPKATDTSTRHVRGDITAEVVLPQATRGLARDVDAQPSGASSTQRTDKDATATPSTRPCPQNMPAPEGVSSSNPEGESDMDPAAATVPDGTPDAMLHTNKPEDDFSPAKTAAWVALVFVLIIVALAVLARLPVLE